MGQQRKKQMKCQQNSHKTLVAQTDSMFELNDLTREMISSQTLNEDFLDILSRSLTFLAHDIFTTFIDPPRWM